jgi:very-short-patch-repair endonuclease
MAKLDDNAIAALALRQRGVVSVRQLHAAGFDAAAIKRRCRAGRLHRMHRGVYLVGHAVAPERAVEIAAVLACQPNSVVSHRSAARLWGLPSLQSWRAPIELTIIGRDPGRKSGITLHRANALHPKDIRRVEGIPTTSPARTLVDLATVLTVDDLELAFIDARACGLLRLKDVADALQRHRGRRGASVLRGLLAAASGNGLTRSEAERRMLALIRTAALPAPKVNARVGAFEVDFLWPDQKVIVEVDGYAFHASQRSFERDRERDATLIARGYVALRVTWHQLVARRDSVIARIAAALAVRS